MPRHHEETPHCLGMGKVVLWNLQKSFSNPQWRAKYLRVCHILSTNGLSMSIRWSRCSIRNFSNLASNSVTTFVNHGILCRSDYRKKGLGHHITPNRQCPEELGFPPNTKIKNQHIILNNWTCILLEDFSSNCCVKKNTISDISTRAGYLVYEEVSQTAAEKGSLAWSSIVADEETKWKRLLEKWCVWWWMQKNVARQSLV